MALTLPSSTWARVRCLRVADWSADGPRVREVQARKDWSWYPQVWVSGRSSRAGQRVAPVARTGRRARSNPDRAPLRARAGQREAVRHQSLTAGRQGRRRAARSQEDPCRAGPQVQASHDVAGPGSRRDGAGRSGRLALRQPSGPKPAGPPGRGARKAMVPIGGSRPVSRLAPLGIGQAGNAFQGQMGIPAPDCCDAEPFPFTPKCSP